MSQQSVRPVWTPHDTAVLQQLAQQYPREVGESAVLADLMEIEVR